MLRPYRVEMNVPFTSSEEITFYPRKVKKNKNVQNHVSNLRKHSHVDEDKLQAREGVSKSM